MNRGQVREEVRDILGELVADFWTNAELNRYIQEALYRFAAEERWVFYTTEGTDEIEDGDSDLALTAGVASSRHMNITLTKDGDTRSYQPVRVSAQAGFRLRTAYTNTHEGSYPEYFYTVAVVDDEGEPTYWLRFIPTPSSDMDVDFQYYREPATLDADGDVPDLPVKYHKALVHHAAGTAWLKEKDEQQKASEQFGLYGAVVDQAKSEWATEPDDAPLVMGKAEPQYDGEFGNRDYYLSRMPETLGP